jgi:DNA polymerase-3 subunit epsilon
MYAVIDIETTGGSARLERITEIAVYIHDGERIVEEYSTLINPERNIPYFITSLTGITNEMVEDAPKFYEVARRIVEITEEHVFVAHNARFDYSFIRQEFSMLGYNFKRPMLDTVALSRKLLPGHKSYGLGNLCKDLGITINGRHRASGDALATVRLLELLIEKDNSLRSGSLIRNRKAAKLHPDLNPESLKDIPEEPGIYFFHDEKGDILYVGKSRNLSQRINTHLSNNTSVREMEMRSMTAGISWERTGSELIALLMESAEIKSKKPRFNRAQRRTGFRWGIWSDTDKEGYIRFSYRNVSDDEVPLALFTSRDRARGKLEQIITAYNLCQKLCGLYETGGACFHHQVGLCRGACTGTEDPKSYNERALMALDEFIFRERNFFIIDHGRDVEERSAVKIVNGKYAGFGFFSINDVGFGLLAVHECIKPAADNRDIQVIIKSYLRNHRVEKIIDF